jgi:hypothetical protein
MRQTDWTAVRERVQIFALELPPLPPAAQFGVRVIDSPAGTTCAVLSVPPSFTGNARSMHPISLIVRHNMLGVSVVTNNALRCNSYRIVACIR